MPPSMPMTPKNLGVADRYGCSNSRLESKTKELDLLANNTKKPTDLAERFPTESTHKNRVRK